MKRCCVSPQEDSFGGCPYRFAVGTLDGTVFASCGLRTFPYIFVTTDCDQETSTFRVLAKDSQTSRKEESSRLIPWIRPFEHYARFCAHLCVASMQFQSSSRRVRCYGTCPESDECCKGEAWTVTLHGDSSVVRLFFSPHCPVWGTCHVFLISIFVSV